MPPTKKNHLIWNFRPTLRLLNPLEMHDEVWPVVSEDGVSIPLLDDPINIGESIYAM